MYVFQDCHGNNKAKIFIVLFTKWGFTIRYSTSKINVFDHLITIGRALVVGSIASPHSTFGQKAG